MFSDKRPIIIYERYNGNSVASPGKYFMEDIIELQSHPIELHRVSLKSGEDPKTLCFSYDSSNEKFSIRYYINNEIDTEALVSKDELKDMVYSFINA